MKKRYVVVFGVRLLGYDRLTGSYTLPLVLFEQLPVYRDEHVFLTETAARRFVISDKSIETKIKISRWLNSNRGLEWKSEKAIMDWWEPECIIFKK